MELHDIEKRFSFHTGATEGKANAHESIRTQAKAFAHFINQTVPEGQEKHFAIGKVEEAFFWANAAIARDGK